MYLLHILDNSTFEIIDSDFLHLYDINADDLIELADEQVDKYNLYGNQYTIFKNGDFVYAPAQPSAAHEWNGTEWVIDAKKHAALKAQQIEQIRAQINAKRNTCVAGGCYVAQIGKWIDTDDAGQTNLGQIKADFDVNGKEQEFDLICADNSVYQLNYDDFVAVWNVVRDLKKTMYENAYMHKVLLETSDEPLNYDWSIGWSKTYEEYSKEQNDE